MSRVRPGRRLVAVAATTLAGGTAGARSAALAVILVLGPRAGTLVLVGVLDAVRLLMRFAVLAVVDLGAHAVADAMVVGGRTGRVGVVVRPRAGRVGVDVSGPDRGLAPFDDLGHTLGQLPGTVAAGGRHGHHGASP